jgi:transcriptional regulator with XRE-family HTH domain
MTRTFPENEPGLQRLGQNLAAARQLRSLSQQELATRSGLKQVQISNFERGKRWPTLPQLNRLAQVLEVTLEYLLNGPERPKTELRAIAFELRNLGIVDLKVAEATVPSAFRPVEQVIVLAVSGDDPEPRIIEAIPAVLAWNSWNASLLKAYALTHDRRAIHRVAWLADIALAIDKAQGFPGGFFEKHKLSRFLRSAKPSRSPDSLGRPAGDMPLPPVWRRWNITYAGNLTTFQERAEHLRILLEKRRFWKSFFFHRGRREISESAGPRISSSSSLPEETLKHESLANNFAVHLGNQPDTGLRPQEIGITGPVYQRFAAPTKCEYEAKQIVLKNTIKVVSQVYLQHCFEAQWSFPETHTPNTRSIYPLYLSEEKPAHAR